MDKSIDLKTPEQSARHLPVVRDDGGNELVMAQDDGFGTSATKVNVSGDDKTERTRRNTDALGNEFCAKHVAKRGSNLKVGRVENYRDETSVRVRKGRIGLGE